MAALNVTTGPGGINALNGVFGAYVDSIPMIVISGQVKRETYAPNFPLALRQLGDQEVNIVAMAAGVTKFAATLQDPNDARRMVEQALWLARRGRPGPVWIDIPGDIQGALVDPEALPGFEPQDFVAPEGVAVNTRQEEHPLDGEALQRAVDEALDALSAAERPVVFAGAGVRLSGGHAEFLRFVEALGAPVVTGWNAHDALPNSHPMYAGRPGTIGERAGNFAVQTADVLIVLGSRLNIRQVSYNWESFARNARVIMVDIDRAELSKPTLTIDQPIHADLRDFLRVANTRLGERGRNASTTAHLARCKAYLERYPVVLPEYWNTAAPVNPYCFGDVLFKLLEDDDIIVTGDGTACVTMFQCAQLKPGQRLYTNSGCASMGYDLPGAIGAYYATGAKRIICIAGDGSIMMNLQELQTIVGGRLPIKVFVLNNDGYHSIRQTQENYFPDNVVGCGPDSGLSFPDFARLATAFGLQSSRIEDHAGLEAGIAAALEGEGPTLCEVMIDKAQGFSPKLLSRRLPDGTMVSPQLEDMAPFLSRGELADNMRVDEPVG